MKRINRYISEKLHINKNVKDPYNYHPQTKEELVDCIKEKIEKEGLGTKDNPLDLNDIDTSNITDMSYLFRYRDLMLLSNSGYFDISDWDVSNVTNMEYMFYASDFNGNISRWNVSKVKNMNLAFYDSPLELNPPKWYKE